MYEQIIEYISEFLHIMGYIITGAGILVVLWGFFISFKEFLLMKIKGHSFSVFFAESNRIRALLGTYILFGLEFMIAADILHTFVKPNLDDLIALGIIVAIRTVISFFLAKEVDEARHDRSATPNKVKTT